jgi:hypothetical protein
VSNDTIPRVAVAKALNLTERALQGWERDLGLAAARAPGRPPAYQMGALLRWLLEQGREASALTQARTREMEARAALRELQVRERGGALVRVEDVVATWSDGITALVTAIRQLPTRCADVVRPDDPAAGEDALEGVAEELRAELREAFAGWRRPREEEDLDGVA